VTDLGPCWWVHKDALAGLFLCSACAFAPELDDSGDTDTDSGVTGTGDREAGKTASVGVLAVSTTSLARGFAPVGVASLAHGPTDSPAHAPAGTETPRGVHRAGPAELAIAGARRGGRPTSGRRGT
jgi:hypothetical protein